MNDNPQNHISRCQNILCNGTGGKIGGIWTVEILPKTINFKMAGNLPGIIYSVDSGIVKNYLLTQSDTQAKRSTEKEKTEYIIDLILFA